MVEFIQPKWLNSNVRLENNSCLILNDFFTNEFATALQHELEKNIKYQFVNLNGVTRLSRGQREVGDSYFGSLLAKPKKDIVATNNLLALLESNEFLNLISKIMQDELMFLRPGTPYFMKMGDRICVHDDMSEERHACAVVFNFTRNWKKGYGGNTIVGKVLREVDIETPPDIPFQLTKIYLKKGIKILTPRFNSCLIIKLEKGLAHGVTKIKTNKNRLSFVTIYGSHNKCK